MCGIAGAYYFSPKATVSETLLQRMTDLVAHRGPDDVGYYRNGNVGLGHRRLSIIDLSVSGHQPMSNEDGSVWITYNGEFYNHRAFIDGLKARGYRFRSTSDTETLLHLYEEHGPALLEKIDGMYAFAIWDARRHRLILARDRLGIKPLFYYHDREHLVFASELKALLADRSVPTDLNDAALSNFLHLMSIPDPESIFRGVRKVMPGHYLIVERGQVSERPYWDIQVDQRPAHLSLSSACEQFDAIFHRAVSSHLLADVPVGAFLSGGVDSGSVVATASRVLAEPMKTFTSTFRSLAEFDEGPYAREVADRYGTDHHEFDLTPNLIVALPRTAWHADEPFAISSALPLYYQSQLARQHVKVVLTGDGGDEVFAGYAWRHAEFSESSAPRRPAWRRLLRKVLGAGVGWDRGEGNTQERDRYVRSFSCYQDEDLDGLLVPDMARRIRRAWADNVTQRYYDRFGTIDQLARKLYTDLKSTLVSEMLTKIDRMTMAFGLEARVPFLDHHLVEWAFRLPSEYKIQGTEGKLVVKRAMERYLSREFLHRPKRGFNVPLKIWMRGELREFVRDSLAESALLKRQLFRPEAVERLLRDHADGTLDASNQIFVLLMLELWFQRFVDRRAELHAT